MRQLRCPPPTPAWRRPPGKLGRLVSAQPFTGRPGDVRGDTSASVSQRVRGSHVPKLAIGVSQEKRRRLASSCMSLSLLEVPTVGETWTQLW